MIPYRDDNPHFRAPVVTVGLILLNVIVWLFIQGAGESNTLAITVCELGLIPGEIAHLVHPGSVISLGNGAGCVLGTTPTWYTPITSMFLHGGWMHLIGNMWFLWVFGGNVEDAMGRERFLAFYLLCGLGAALVQVGVDPRSVLPMVGASGAISGVMGAYGFLYPRVRVHLFALLLIIPITFSIPAWTMIGYWFLLQLFSAMLSPGDAGGVAVWAHVGGFVAGVLLLPFFKNAVLVAQHRRLAVWS